MTAGELRHVLLEELGRSAPEADLAGLGANESLREALDLDSFDFLQLIARLETRLEVRIPNEDYPRLDSLAAAIAYLASRAPERPPAPH